MAAATGDRDLIMQPSELVAYGGVSGTEYFSGTMLMTSGLSSDIITPMEQGVTDSIFVGVNSDNVNLSGGDQGSSDALLKVWKTGEFTFEAQGTGVSADIGARAFALDDQTVGNSAASPASIVGVITGIPTSTTYRVRITNYVDEISQ